MMNIKNQTDNLLNIVGDVMDWSAMNKDELIQKSLDQPFQNIRRNLSVIKESLEKRPSIAIFGQSQVGKSYLVQNLAKPFNKKYLMVKGGAYSEGINFLTEMNPDGGKESTGLVTRFTTKNTELDKDFPFEIELFTQLDIASILTNAFNSDLKDFNKEVYDFSKEEIKEVLNKLEEKTKQKGASEDDTFFFIEYIQNNFKDIALIRELTNIGYFIDLQKSLPFINVEKRVEILKYLWGKNTFLSNLFQRLSRYILELSFERKAKVQLGALAPNTNTIIDVERVRDVLNKESSDYVQVKITNKSKINIPRAILSALTKEVQLQIENEFSEEEEQGFLNHADILDFPGSKSREKIPLEVFQSNSTEQKLQLFIRGKVSYLFDSYTSKLGVSTLLYCMDDTPPEEKEAPNRLYKWVKKYVGNSLENRTTTIETTKDILSKVNFNVNTVSPLLVVFTKFNIELNNVLPGRENSIEVHNSKWQARFQENFLNFLSRPVADKWLVEWTEENKNFNFIFPIRDPLYSQATFEGLDNFGIEQNIRPEREEAMLSMKTSFLDSDLVKNHTINSEEIWKEISSPNGTGILYLSKHLKNAAHPFVTETRLNLELEKYKNQIVDLISPYKVSGNINEDLVLARKLSARAFTNIFFLSNSKTTEFNEILKNMIITDTEIWNLLYEHIFSTEKENHEENEDSNTISDEELLINLQDLGIDLSTAKDKTSLLNQFQDLYGNLEENEINEIIQDTYGVSIGQISAMLHKTDDSGKGNDLANKIVEYWSKKLTNKVANEELLSTLKEDHKEIIRGILAEIIKGRERFKLVEKLTSVIDDISTGALQTKDLDLVASCTKDILNKYIFTAGWGINDDKSENELFSDIGKKYSESDLNYSNSKNKMFLQEWNKGIRELYSENVRFRYNVNNQEFDMELNRKLDEILNKIQ